MYTHMLLTTNRLVNINHFNFLYFVHYDVNVQAIASTIVHRIEEDLSACAEFNCLEPLMSFV